MLKNGDHGGRNNYVRLTYKLVEAPKYAMQRDDVTDITIATLY